MDYLLVTRMHSIGLRTACLRIVMGGGGREGGRKGGTEVLSSGPGGWEGCVMTFGVTYMS